MGAIPGSLATAIRPEVLESAIRPGTVANVIRGSVLLVAGVVTDSEDAISLGKQIVSGSSESSSSSGLRQPSPEEVIEMHEELERWKRELSRAKAEPSTSGPSSFFDELEKREAELKEIENKHRQLEEEIRNYPRPAYLEESTSRGGVNIAVVGNSGVGKSLLINSLRDIRSGDPTWAPVGVNQTTQEPVAYAMPGQPDVLLWDLAGVGSQQFIPGGYTRTIGLRHFDVVLVVTTCRFTQTEAVLLSELAGSGVPSFLVRTMVDVDIASNEADHGHGARETKLGIVEDLRERGVPSPYLVNAREPGEHDFPALRGDLLRAARGGAGPRRPEASAAGTPEDPHRELPQMPRPVVKFEVGETAEVWSTHARLWVKCVVEARCEKPDEYEISVPEAPGARLPAVPAAALRKAQSFGAGELAEVIVLQGPRAGSWAKCCVLGEGDKPDTYNIHIPDTPAGTLNLPNIHNSALRKVLPADVPKPPIDADGLKEVLKAFKEICSSKEFQATIDSLQAIGVHKEEVKRMKKTFVSHQFSPVLVRYDVSSTKIGWGGFLAFTRTQGQDPEVVKLAHEVERLLRVRVGDFFGLRAGAGEEVDDSKAWGQRLKDAASGILLQAAQRSHQAAQAQAASGAPTSRSQRVTAGHVDPMSRSVASVASASRWLRSP
mmetsp:Transcript_102535/g.299106  ORF Transcript_102535/g.299106 Transcript_102535/m.299106 type:complete len:662 (-) Transcript_102535:84-2069(-)